MHLPTISEFIYDSFDHQTLAGLPFRGGIGLPPALIDRRGIGQASQLLGGGISAGVGLATTALSSWLADKRATGQQKVASTSIVNDLEPLLRQNANAYLAGPGTCADQAEALAAFDSAWQWLQSAQACGNIQLGTAGQNCINDRAPGGKWDWTAMYRTPIATDPRPQCVTSADAAEQSALANLAAKISGSNVQTVPTSYSQQTGSTSAATTAAALDLSSLTSGSVQIGSLSIPTIALVGLGALLLIMAISK